MCISNAALGGLFWQLLSMRQQSRMNFSVICYVASRSVLYSIAPLLAEGVALGPCPCPTFSQVTIRTHLGDTVYTAQNVKVPRALLCAQLSCSTPLNSNRPRKVLSSSAQPGSL